MKLEKLLERMDYKVLAGSTDIEISTLVYDSRKVEKASVFVCISGAVSDAHDFIPDVVKKGAAAVVVEKDVTPIEGVTYIKVDNTRLALACMSAAYFDYPAEKIKTIGITGTKGKTTTTYMVRSILESAGIKTGLIGTIESICGDKRIPSANTTPESYRVQELFKEMVDEGLDAVVMEVSSQALMLHRVSGFTFDIGVFTNLEPDHIGEHEHKDFADYMHCKSLLFRQCRLGIFNGDDVLGIAFAVVLLLCGMFAQPVTHLLAPGNHAPGAVVLKAAVALVCAVAVLTSGYMLTGLIQTGHRDETVLVLGCSVKGERPSRMLRQRIEAATEYLEKNPDSKAVLSGGQGPDEKISEAECMRRELVRRGIAADRLYLEDRSTSTEENVAFSAKIIEQNGLNRHVTVVTSDFHCRRGMLLCQRAGLTASSTPAATDVYLLGTYWMREMLAVVKTVLHI